MKDWITPNADISEMDKLYIKCGWITLALLFWMSSPLAIIPPLGKVLAAIPLLLKEDFLAMEILASFKLYATALAITIVSSSIIAYSTVIPLFKPIGDFVAKWKAISLIGVLVVFTILTPDGFWLKVAILVFGIAPWFIDSIMSIISSISHERYEYARTLKSSEWIVTWRVVIRETFHHVIESFRQVAIMGVVLLPVAERLSRADGGVGAILASLERFQRLDKIYAIDILIIAFVFGQDWFIKYLRNKIAPHAKLMEKGN